MCHGHRQKSRRNDFEVEPDTAQELRTPNYWLLEFDVKILNPHGWDRGSEKYPVPKCLQDPITRSEYVDRLYVSTISIPEDVMMQLFSEL